MKYKTQEVVPAPYRLLWALSRVGKGELCRAPANPALPLPVPVSKDGLYILSWFGGREAGNQKNNIL